LKEVSSLPKSSLTQVQEHYVKDRFQFCGS
jgi:hypothetical protein